jgi:hypothetical protein
MSWNANPANLVYRDFERVGASNPPDAKGVEIALGTNTSLVGD